MPRATKSLPLLFLLLLMAGTSLIAQTSKGTLAGVVRDASGAVVANATVTIESQLTGEVRTAQTNGGGEYRLDAINPSLYTINTSAQGFAANQIKDVEVTPSVVTSRDIMLSVGTVTGTVTVQGTTNGINLENGQLSGTIDTSDLKTLPIFSLNPIELATTIPGVQYVNPMLNLQGAGGNYEQIEVNGSRPRANNFMMDSQDINDVSLGGQAFQPQIPDIFQSVTVLTNSPAAEYGRAGGAVVNLVTKSGTNQFHGSAFELYSGSGLNSVDGQTRLITPKSSANKARYDEHQFGFTGGGPVWRNKLFLFGASQWTRFYGNSNSSPIELPDQNGYNVLTSIGGPNVALLQGLLNSGTYLNQYNFVGATAPINVGQPTTGASGACPASGCVVTTGLFERPPVPQQEPDLQYIIRGDYTPNQKDSFAVRFLRDNATFTPDLGLNTSGLPGFDGEVGGPSYLSYVNWTHVFSPRLLNEFRASMTRIDFLFQATPETNANPLAKNYSLEFQDAYNGGSTPSFPVLGISQNIPQGRLENFYQFQDTVSWNIGRQSIRMGADIGRILETDLVAQEALGQLTVTSSAGFTGMGNYLNDNLGKGGTATRTFGPTRFDPHIWRSAGFVQDDVKVMPDLTLNLGLRYDYITDPSNSLPYPGIDVEDPFAPITNVYKVNTGNLNFGPRFGFAYAPSGGGWLGSGKTVVHGGAGIFYDTDFSNIPVNSAQSSPNAVSTTLISQDPTGLGNALSLVPSITPAPISPFSSVLSVDKNLVNPRVYQWNLGIERALPADLKFTFNYVGTRGRKLYANQQYNYFDFNTGERLNPDRGAVNARGNTAASEYDSLQAELSRRFSHGLTFRAAYTYGKNLDNGSEVFTLFNSSTSYSANLAPGGRRQDWGASAFDFPQFFSVAYTWAPLGIRSDNHTTDMLLSGLTRHWSFSGVTQLQAGPPSTFTLPGVDTNGDGSATNDRPIIGSVHAPINTAGIDGFYIGGTPGVYYDYGQFNSTGNVVVVSPSQVHWLIPYGPQFMPLEVGRNSFRNPGTTIWNVAAEKDIPAPWTHLESATFQLRAEVQNIGNHNDVGVLDTSLLDIGTTSFMNTTNARATTNRNLRFWLKFSF
ncbi:carboxypeptidase regulatory-like domain-containing protein [Alloacidobacterium dinghuense]|uniref:Carboxypeptidase regulatory-like domain-containing protein n=1 Tax=Alloacidobacterium dinghuense TaxID=2763107 RepID=A0A7G8BDD9_9BACT|nr:carboxypeptidase regulatory-like domain-containing protein [Alloacidobacterium dinghuense]QNI30559.1 carboxypeptidase regulatory-like domain-containing protein [Alloacidobacterium dinghuense]